MSSVQIYTPDSAPLPINYEAARKALAECVSIDECKEWRDRAAAIASYAFQKRDRTMFDAAERIKARATRSMGEMVNKVKHTSRRKLRDIAKASGLGMSEMQVARNVAKVEHKTFENHVERSPPTPISRLSALGTNPRGADESGPIWKLAESLRKLMRDYPAAALAASIAECSPEQRKVLRAAFTPASEWLDAIAVRVEK